jgi:hypothetical protein
MATGRDGQWAVWRSILLAFTFGISGWYLIVETVLWLFSR